MMSAEHFVVTANAEMDPGGRGHHGLVPRLIAPLVADGVMRARPQPILRVADQLVLRPWRLGDVDAVVAAYADREIQQ